MIRAGIEDLDILTRTIAGEARGEDDQGRIAVAHVILNRVKADLHGDGKPDWWGEGIAGVCQKKWQFSCWNESDPNSDYIARLTPGDPVYQEALWAALSALLGKSVDPTGGATHYHTTNIQPAWAEGHAPNCIIGRHAFYDLT